MRAIILAAGIGSRLTPQTNEKPKTLVEVNGIPMLGYIIKALWENAIIDIVICVGYKAEQIFNYCQNSWPQINFTFVENKDFLSTNNMYSLYLAKKFLDQDILLMNADLVFDKEIITGLKEMPMTSVAVDKGNYLEESMKVVVEKKVIKNISKTITPEVSYGCSIDIYKIVEKDLQIIKDELQRIIEVRGDRRSWTEVMLNNLFSSSQLIAQPYDIGNSRWFEIDNFDDLSEAEKKFSEKLS